MGYIQENGQKIIMKLDAGEALPFLTDMNSSTEIKHDPRSRNMIVGTNGTKIAFEELNKKYQQEFVEASSDILIMGD